MIRTSSGLRSFVSPNPRASAPPPKFIPELWKARITEATYQRIHENFPKLILNFEGEILHLGDIVWFGEHYLHHGLITDKTLSFIHVVDNPIDAQSDMGLMKTIADGISGSIVNGLGISGAGHPALFAGGITDLEEVPNMSFGSHIRGILIYGYRSLNPIRTATEIIARCQSQGFSHDRIAKELERFF